MSYWTYINGNIKVDVPGRTQPEIEYILKSIIDHLPIVTGSEHDMDIYLNKVNGINCSSSHDEYEMRTNNLTDIYGNRNRNGSLNTQSEYLITVDASLRDRMFEETFKEFMKWLCRLSKRISVDSILVKIEGYDELGNKREYIINEGYESPYDDMYEYPSWSNKTGEPCWWEHLTWDRYNNWPLPINHVVKYFECEEADKEFGVKTEVKK
jgi:hypothetical protein